MAEDRPRQTEPSLLRGGLAGRSYCVLAARRCHARCPKRWSGALTVKQSLRLYDARRRTPRTPTLVGVLDRPGQAGGGRAHAEHRLGVGAGLEARSGGGGGQGDGGLRGGGGGVG